MQQQSVLQNSVNLIKLQHQHKKTAFLSAENGFIPNKKPIRKGMGFFP